MSSDRIQCVIAGPFWARRSIECRECGEYLFKRLARTTVCLPREQDGNGVAFKVACDQIELAVAVEIAECKVPGTSSGSD